MPQSSADRVVGLSATTFRYRECPIEDLADPHTDAPMTGRQPDSRRPRRVAAIALIASCALVAAVVAVIVLVSASGPARPAGACVYPGSTRADLRHFEQVLGRRVDCVVEYSSTAPTWAQWADPWFVSNAGSNANWSTFARAPGHQMILSISLFPTSVQHADWRRAGAAGAYVAHARELARNLVRAGMGHTVIRLAHEANGVTYADNVGTTRRQETRWREFWRRTALAMRSVPGAHFDFNWCIENGPRPIPFADYYPGNDVVDSIGDDIYDSGLPKNVSYRDRWQYVYGEAGGVRALARFAQENHKPLTVPEWGLMPRSEDGGGSDPAFTRGFLAFLRHDHVKSEAYFFSDGSRSALLGDSASLDLYRDRILG